MSPATSGSAPRSPRSNRASSSSTCTAARRFLPELIRLTWDRKISPGKVFDLTLPLEQAADGYAAMDSRTAIKVLLQP